MYTCIDPKKRGLNKKENVSKCLPLIMIVTEKKIIKTHPQYSYGDLWLPLNRGRQYKNSFLPKSNI